MTIDVLRKNFLLHELSDTHLVLLGTAAKLVNLSRTESISTAKIPLRRIFFPIDSMISIVALMKDGTIVEVGAIGREGVTALPLLMGSTASQFDYYCRLPGRAIEMTVRAFWSLYKRDRAFHRRTLRFLYAHVNVVRQLVACNQLHTLYQRCARWLLLSYDRTGCASISITHEALAALLGSQRPGVSLALARLQREACLSYAQGSIELLDRQRLEAVACECYVAAREQLGYGVPHATSWHFPGPNAEIWSEPREHTFVKI